MRIDTVLSLWANMWVRVTQNVGKDDVDSELKKASATIGLFWIYSSIVIALFSVVFILMGEHWGRLSDFQRDIVLELGIGFLITSFVMAFVNMLESTWSILWKGIHGKTAFDSYPGSNAEKLNKCLLLQMIIIIIFLLAISSLGLVVNALFWWGYIVIGIFAIYVYFRTVGVGSISVTGGKSMSTSKEDKGKDTPNQQTTSGAKNMRKHPNIEEYRALRGELQTIINVRYVVLAIVVAAFGVITASVVSADNRAALAPWTALLYSVVLLPGMIMNLFLTIHYRILDGYLWAAFDEPGHDQFVFQRAYTKLESEDKVRWWWRAYSVPLSFTYAVLGCAAIVVALLLNLKWGDISELRHGYPVPFFIGIGIIFIGTIMLLWTTQSRANRKLTKRLKEDWSKALDDLADLKVNNTLRPGEFAPGQSEAQKHSKGS